VSFFRLSGDNVVNLDPGSRFQRYLSRGPPLVFSYFFLLPLIRPVFRLRRKSLIFFTLASPRSLE